MKKWVPEHFRKYIPGKKLSIALALGTVAIGGTAIAAQAARAGPADTNGDGIVTRAESQAIAAQRFAMLDANKDGKLDPTDRAGAPQMLFNMMDTDKNGQISQAEFDAARLRRLDAMGERAGGRERWRGGRHDGPHGGMGRGGMMRGGGAMMALADSNKDGAISQAEFAARAQQRFDAIDSDKNGQLTAAERIAARMAMRDRWKAGASPAAPAAPAAKPAPTP